MDQLRGRTMSQHDIMWGAENFIRAVQQAGSKSAPCSPVKPFQKRAPAQPDSFHVIHKVPLGDSPYVKAKHVQLVDKDPDAAIALFWAAINAGDRVDSALKDMAIVMKQQNRPGEAIEAIKSLRSRCSDAAQESLDNVLLDLYKRCGRLDDQIALLKHKLHLIHQGMAFNGKRTKTARSQGKKFQVSIEQEATRLLGNLGWAYMQQSNFLAAEAVYRKALSIGPDNNKVCNLGICLMKQGRTQEAKAMLQSVVPACPDTRWGSDSHLKSYERAQEMLLELEASMTRGIPMSSATSSSFAPNSAVPSSLWQPQAAGGAAAASQLQNQRSASNSILDYTPPFSGALSATAGFGPSAPDNSSRHLQQKKLGSILGERQASSYEKSAQNQPQLYECSKSYQTTSWEDCEPGYTSPDENLDMNVQRGGFNHQAAPQWVSYRELAQQQEEIPQEKLLSDARKPLAMQAHNSGGVYGPTEENLGKWAQGTRKGSEVPQSGYWPDENSDAEWQAAQWLAYSNHAESLLHDMQEQQNHKSEKWQPVSRKQPSNVDMFQRDCARSSDENLDTNVQGVGRNQAQQWASDARQGKEIQEMLLQEMEKWPSNPRKLAFERSLTFNNASSIRAAQASISIMSQMARDGTISSRENFTGKNSSFPQIPSNLGERPPLTYDRTNSLNTMSKGSEDENGASKYNNMDGGWGKFTTAALKSPLGNSESSFYSRWGYNDEKRPTVRRSLSLESFDTQLEQIALENEALADEETFPPQGGNQVKRPRNHTPGKEKRTMWNSLGFSFPSLEPLEKQHHHHAPGNDNNNIEETKRRSGSLGEMGTSTDNSAAPPEYVHSGVLTERQQQPASNGAGSAAAAAAAATDAEAIQRQRRLRVFQEITLFPGSPQQVEV